MTGAPPTPREFAQIELAARDAIAMLPDYLRYPPPPAPRLRCGHGSDTACRHPAGCTTRLTFLAPVESADA